MSGVDCIIMKYWEQYPKMLASRRDMKQTVCCLHCWTRIKHKRLMHLVDEVSESSFSIVCIHKVSAKEQFNSILLSKHISFVVFEPVAIR